MINHLLSWYCNRSTYQASGHFYITPYRLLAVPSDWISVLWVFLLIPFQAFPNHSYFSLLVRSGRGNPIFSGSFCCHALVVIFVSIRINYFLGLSVPDLHSLMINFLPLLRITLLTSSFAINFIHLYSIFSRQCFYLTFILFYSYYIHILSLIHIFGFKYNY